MDDLSLDELEKQVLKSGKLGIVDKPYLILEIRKIKELRRIADALEELNREGLSVKE